MRAREAVHEHAAPLGDGRADEREQRREERAQPLGVSGASPQSETAKRRHANAGSSAK